MREVHQNQFHLEKFDGPLDLLLFLIKKNEVSIYDISIAQITAQYLDFMNSNMISDIDSACEFYLMAATLIYIKSKVLLPIEINLDDEIDDPWQELVEQLIEYQKYKKLTTLMIEKKPQDEWIIEREPEQRNLPFDNSGAVWQEVDVWELLTAFSRIMSNLVPERIIDLYEEVSINEKLTLIREKIQTSGEFPFTEIVVRPDSTMDIICAFLALLELVKSRFVKIYQHQLFGDILIRARITEGGEGAVAN